MLSNISLSSLTVVGRSFRIFLALIAFQELSELQQNVHHPLLGPRENLPMTSKGCLCLLFSQLSLSLRCAVLCYAQKSICWFQRRGSLSSFVEDIFTQSLATRAGDRFTFCCPSFYFSSNRKHAMQLHRKQTAQEPSVLLQLGTDFMLNPQYQERAHLCRKLSN